MAKRLLYMYKGKSLQSLRVNFKDRFHKKLYKYLKVWYWLNGFRKALFSVLKQQVDIFNSKSFSKHYTKQFQKMNEIALILKRNHASLVCPYPFYILFCLVIWFHFTITATKKGKQNSRVHWPSEEYFKNEMEFKNQICVKQ